MNFRQYLSTKGQAEMIGLVIIVVLITVGMLFMAQFAFKSDPEKKIFTRKGLAYSTTSALMKTELECNDITGSTGTIKYLEAGGRLLDDCAKNFDYENNAMPSDFQCDGKHSCIFLEEQFAMMMNETLGVWGKNYEFKSTLLSGTQGHQLIYVSNGGCLRAKERDSSGIFPIYAQNVGLIENTLFLCD